MSRTTLQKGLALILLATGVLAFCLLRHAPTAAKAADPRLVDGRLWVDSQPIRHTDYVQAVAFLSPANFGIFQRASSYDIHVEFFDMTRNDKTIRLTFPQSNRSAEFRYTVRECHDRKPFDLCLDLSDNPWGGPSHYYGFSQPDEERRALGVFGRDLRNRATLRAAE
jgi:hypothetical protein